MSPFFKTVCALDPDEPKTPHTRHNMHGIRFDPLRSVARAAAGTTGRPAATMLTRSVVIVLGPRRPETGSGLFSVEPD